MKEQKRLGNKGFSLVELIVVIAIMAILIAVLAPTLISKIEESRESTDIKALDEIRQAVVTALADEDVYKELVNTSANQVYEYNLSAVSIGKTKADAELKETLEAVEFKSNAASGKKVFIHVSTKGKVYAEVVTGDNASTAAASGQTYGGSAVTSGDADDLTVFAVGTYPGAEATEPATP